MKRALRLAELILLVGGISLLGIASAGTVSRWKYQSEGERALLEREPAPLPTPAEETITAEVSAKPLKVKAEPRPLALLEIPRLRVKAVVKDGDDEKTLLRAVGRVPGSARPGEGGNVVLAGHRDTFFYPLQDIKENDRIRLFVPPRSYDYRVQSVRIVEPEETEVLKSRGREELTLVTCYPFHFVGPAPQRFVVTAVRK